jgi:hypothetical protein
MTDRSPEPAPASKEPLRALLIGFALVIAIGAGAIAGRLSARPAPEPTSVTVVRPTPAVVTALRDLARLESAQAHVERVIDLRDKQTRFFGLLEAEDAILLVASGDVVAGVDLAKLGEADVSIDMEAKRATIRLPAPEILSARLDSSNTYVHARSTELLARRNERLETEARKEAERTIVEAARKSGLLDRAASNAKRTVESLVRSLGYSEVVVELGRH